MGLEIAIAAVSGIAALWLFVRLHSHRDIEAYRETERRRVQYGQSKFASPALREKVELPSDLATVVFRRAAEAANERDSLQRADQLSGLYNAARGMQNQNQAAYQNAASQAKAQSAFRPGWPLIAGKADYSIGPEGADIENRVPESITSAQLILDQAGRASRMPLNLLDVGAWAEVEQRRNGQEVAGLPTSLYFEPGHPNGILHLFPTPPNDLLSILIGAVFS